MAERDSNRLSLVNPFSKRECCRATESYVSPTRQKIEKGISLIHCYLDDKYLTDEQKESIRLVLNFAISHVIDLEKPRTTNYGKYPK